MAEQRPSAAAAAELKMHSLNQPLQVLNGKEKSEFGHMEIMSKSPVFHFANSGIEQWLWKFPIACNEWPKAVAAAVAAEVAVLSMLLSSLESHRMDCHEVAASGPIIQHDFK